MADSTIILIGPMMAGKSTVGELLAERLGLPQVALDEIRWDYFDEIGYDHVAGKRIAAESGMTGLMAHWKPYEVHAVERVLAEYINCVIDFGAGYTVQKDENLFERVKTALAPYPNIFLLLPTPDLDESLVILNERMEALLIAVGQPEEDIPDVLAANETFVMSPHNGMLAKHIIYNKDKTPAETCDEIIELIQ